MSMTNDIDNMTSTQISEEIRALRERARDGGITPAQADRLSLLQAAKRRVDHAVARKLY